jgi:3-oxoacyl-[acyl-carrier protein] reductase
MELGLQDSVVFVSGSSRGIGRAIAARFLDEGARVTLTGRDEHVLTTAQSALAEHYGADRVFAFSGDLTDPKTVRVALAAAAAHWGGLDHLVANLGDGRSVGGWKVGDAEWSRMMQLNFGAAAALVESALPQMIGRPGATITAIGSIAGLEALGAPLPYASAKAALAAYCNALARQLGADGLRVNCVMPGNILFPGGSWEEKLSADRAAVEAYIEAEVPLQRFGRPEEIADMVAFLSSARAAFVTGACIVADGGQTRGVY